MKITYSILALCIIAILITWTQLPEISRDDRRITALPWIIQTDAQGGSRVFDLDIGQSSIAQAEKVFQDTAEFGIFIESNGQQSLEAFFGQVRLAGLQARAVLNLQVDEATLNRYAAEAIDKSGQPSNSYKLKLPDELLPQLLQHSFTSLTYLPKLNIEDELITLRFGKPARTEIPKEKIRIWLYPEKGLSITRVEDEKPVFHYVRPRDFERYLSLESTERNSSENQGAVDAQN